MKLKINKKEFVFKDKLLVEDFLKIGFPPFDLDKIDPDNIDSKEAGQLLPYLIKLLNVCVTGNIPIDKFELKHFFGLFKDSKFVDWLSELFNLNL